MNKCKICNKPLGDTYIEDVTQCCIDCLRLFTEPDDEITNDNFEKTEDKK